jgi:hypothetical protein
MRGEFPLNSKRSLIEEAEKDTNYLENTLTNLRDERELTTAKKTKRN